MLTAVTTQGVPSNITETNTFMGNRVIERYRIEVAKENGYLRYITLSASISQPAVSIVWSLFGFIVSTYMHRYSHWDRVGLVMPIDIQSHYLDQ